MRLTPADVHNVAFKKPSIGKRGYDEDEVDAFLDLVEAELSRLIEENNELTQRLTAGQAGGFVAGAPIEAAPQHQPDAVQQYIEQVPADDQHDHEAPETQPEPVSVQKAPEVVAPVPTAAPVPESGPAAHHVQAAKLLGLAQETAERLTGDAAAEAEATRSAAKAESEKLVGDAQTEAHRLVSEAQDKSDSMVNEATAKAEALERDSRIRADAMDREAQGKYSQVMSQLTEQRTTLEKKIDDLRVYEREYRSRLKSWITDQLSQLDESGAPVNDNNEVHAE
jgi:DivIVA domain-containing protein